MVDKTVNGPAELENEINEMKKMAEPKMFSRLPFFSSSSPKMKDRSILYVNNDQQFLIVTNGKTHYCYDIKYARAASQEIKNTLGKGLHDVSGEEQQRELQRLDYDVYAVRRKLLAELPKEDKEREQFGLKKIQEAQRRDAEKQLTPSNQDRGRLTGG